MTGSSEELQPRADAATSAAPAEFGAATLAGRFELLAELGSGSSGTVYRARLRREHHDLPAGTDVAVKFLRRDRLDDERAHARLHAEGRLGRRVRHANVAAIHGVETIDVLGMELTYLVMEYVDGTTLRRYLQQQGPPVEDLTRRIGADAARGLHALHRCGLVHRDLKPENLVLTPGGEVKIVDLGLARTFGEAGRDGSRPDGRTGERQHGSDGDVSSGHGVAGSIAYAAPEVLSGGAATPRSDLYSLGVVLYEVATGRHPFAHRTDTDAMIHAHLHEAPARPSHHRPRMTPMLDRLLLDLLAKTVDARPRDADEVARILQQGETCEWWRKHEQREPVLASRRRLRRLRRPSDTGLFGREAELDLLDEHYASARAGQGRALCIAGPHGIGRRRLLDEAMSRWLSAGDDVLFLGGEADPGLGHGEPFAGAVLDRLLRGEGADAPHAATRAEARARAELGLDEASAHALIAVALGTSSEEPGVRASRLCNALLHLAQKGRVLVLRVEGGERLDTSARLVLERLCGEGRQSHLLLLVTASPDWEPPAAFERVELQGLDHDAFAAFARALFRSPADHSGQLAAAHATFSGSPGNLIEALDHLAQTGVLTGRPGDYTGLDPRLELRPAPGHLARFEQRVARLAPEARRVLSAAAVLGVRSSLADVVALAAVNELQVLEALSLFRGRILTAQGGEVVFRHRDFQRATLRRLGTAERTALHAAAAAQLAARGRPPLEVGLQLSHALDHEGCIAPLLAGLDGLVRAGSRRTSLRIAARLGVHLQQLPATPRHDASRLQHLLLSARARRNAGQAERATALCRAAETLAQRLGDRRGSGEALTGLALAAFEAGHLLQAISLLENAHRELDDSLAEGRVAHDPGPDGERARLLAADAHGLHGRILLYLGQSEAGLRHVQAALRLLPADEVDLQSHLLVDRARLEALRHHYPTALKTLARVASAEAARHLPRVRMRHLLYRGQIRSLLGDEDAAQDLRQSAELARRLSLPAYRARAHVFLGERALLLRREDEAQAEFATARSFAEQADDRLGGALAAIQLLRLGAPQPGLEAQVEQLGLPSLTVALRLALAERARAAGDDRTLAVQTALALDLCESADVPLSLHLRALFLANLDASARSLARSIAERLPDRRSRRRFLRTWEQGGRG